MTTLELLNFTRDLLPYETIPDIGSLLILLNRAYQQVAQRTQSIHQKIIRPVAYDSISLPPYVVSLLTAVYLTPANHQHSLEILHWADATARYGDKAVHSPSAGTPRTLAVFSHSLVKVIPRPVGGGVIEAIASVVPHIQGEIKPLVGDTDEPALPITEHDVLSYLTAMLVLASYPQYRQIMQNYSQIVLEKMATLAQVNETLPSHPIMLAPGASGTMPVIRGYII